MVARLNYLELPVTDVHVAKTFYAAAFGWAFADYGPTYAATATGGTDIGLQGDPSQATARALPVIEVDDLDAALTAVAAAGGTVTMPVFAFPGGHRFHFRDPDSHELAAMKPD